MARKSLRSHLNQIRAWVRQGRTDAWIAHQLEIPASELREFRRRHALTPDGDEAGGEDIDLRDEIEAEVEAATLASEEEEEEADEGVEEAEEPEPRPEAAEEPEPRPEAAEEREEPDRRPRRRRRRRRGRGARTLQATFDHGTDEGYGLWLDPAVADDPVYEEHWKGHRAVEVEVEADRITIRRAG